MKGKMKKECEESQRQEWSGIPSHSNG